MYSEPCDEKTIAAVYYECNLFIQKTAKQATCHFAVFYFHIVFSLLVVDCQVEILEFFFFFFDVIGRQRNARSHQKVLNCSLPDSLLKQQVLSLSVKFFIQFIFE